jgi:hypothetical protein
MVLPVNKVMVILDTEDDAHKMATITEVPAYTRLYKDPTETMERKTSALMRRRCSLPKEVCELL